MRGESVTSGFEDFLVHASEGIRCFCTRVVGFQNFFSFRLFILINGVARDIPSRFLDHFSPAVFAAAVREGQRTNRNNARGGGE